MSGEYKPPSWAGFPQLGLHLDVVKGGSVLQKLLIDEKDYYLFGRNTDVCDFPLQHESCSRVHAALVHHKHLKRPFLIDFGSAHGTFVGNMHLEAHKPQQLFVDTSFSFGASTRTYTLRERPQQVSLVTEETEGDGGTLLGLAELDNEVDDLTQYNTAHNRQISTIGISTDGPIRKRQHRRSASVNFAENEDIINPEDIDPSIGKFRNMIQSSVVIPAKRPRIESSDEGSSSSSHSNSGGVAVPFTQPLRSPSAGQQQSLHSPSSAVPSTNFSFSSSTFLSKSITAAPPVDDPTAAVRMHFPSDSALPSWSVPHQGFDEPLKKKYAKESWPGKIPPSHLLV